MSSIIEGYNYDIFISYRQKDNKGDRWVSEFVEALKTELESTFKEEISVYFDINPHDGLLETHDVDESLKEKLKCLIFIPIISRTYCDPKSFAWEHEFKAFIEKASKDPFGLKIKLPNGNVANRIIAVQIHDLYPEDKAIIEQELGGVLRAIEFIYKEPGVNRPLTNSDDEKLNLNKTKYRNQINKVANAIDEIIHKLKEVHPEVAKEKVTQKELFRESKHLEERRGQERPIKSISWKKLAGTFTFVVLLVIAAIIVYPKLSNSTKYKPNSRPLGKVFIVVNRFDNKTGDESIDSWRDILPDLLRGYLATSTELSIQNSQTMSEAYKSIKLAKSPNFEDSQSDQVARMLNADFYLTGSFQRIGNKELIVSNLINTKIGEVLLTRSVEGSLDTGYKIMVDSLARQFKNFLEIKAIEQNLPMEYKESFTNSVEALRKYREGMKSIMNGDYTVAAKTLEEAYRIDTTFAFAAFFCSFAYCYYDHIKASSWEQKAYLHKEKLTEDYRMWLEFWHGWFATKNISDILNYCSIIEKSDTKSRFILFDIGCAFSNLGQPDKSVNMFEKAEKVSSEWGEDWKYRDFYTYFANACHNAGKSEKEAKVLEIGLKLFPDNYELIWGQAKLALSKGNSKRTQELINKYEYLCKRSGISESEIVSNMGSLFEEVDSLKRAEQYYRKALALEPDDAMMMNNLAYLLIDEGRNINEGLELIDKALIIRPDDYTMLNTKGWGLYKQGKFKEALQLLEKSWDLTPSYSGRGTYLHLEEAKKAVASQKNN